MHYLKKNFLTLIVITLLIAFGILLILLDPELLIKIFMYVVAIMLIIMAIGFLISAKQYVGNDKTKLIIQSIILIILSVLLMIFPKYITRIIIGIIFLLIPIMELIYATDKSAQFKEDIWKYIVGIILVLSFTIVLKFVLIFLGVFLILIAGYLIYLLIKHHNDKNIPNVLVIIFLKQFFRKDDKDTWEL